MKRSRIRPRRARRIDRETTEETEYKHWLHTQACVVTGYVGPEVQASHVGSGGMGMKKGSWFDAVPMRADVHREWEEHAGRFAGKGRYWRQGQAILWIAATLAKWRSASVVAEGIPF